MKVRERFGRFFRKRAVLIVISLLLSIALWFYIEYNENESISVTLSNISVEYVNKDILSDRALAVTDWGATVVSVKFEGPRSVVAKLSNSTVRATVDLQAIRDSGSKSLQYVIEYDETKIDSNSSKELTLSGYSGNGYVTLGIEKVISKNVFYRANYEGSLTAEGYKLGTIVFGKEYVTIKGPKSVVDAVASADVMIQRENLTETYSAYLPYVLFDAAGNQIDISRLTSVSEDSVYTVIPIELLKTIPITLDVTYGAGATSANTQIVITPATITISGEAEDLSINSIKIGSLDLTSIETTYTATLPIILPDGVENVSGVTEATVTVQISGVVVKTFNIRNFEYLNAPAGYEISPMAEFISVKVRGPEVIMNTLTEEMLTVKFDFAQFVNSTGTFTIKGTLSSSYYSSDQIGALGTINAVFRISEENG